MQFFVRIALLIEFTDRGRAAAIDVGSVGYLSPELAQDAIAC